MNREQLEELRVVFSELSETEKSNSIRTLLSSLGNEPPVPLARQMLAFLGGRFEQFPSLEQNEVYEFLLKPLSVNFAVEGTRLRAVANITGKVTDDVKRQEIFRTLLSILTSYDKERTYREAAAEALVDYATLTELQKGELDLVSERLYRTGALKGNRFLGNYMAARNLSSAVRR